MLRRAALVEVCALLGAILVYLLTASACVNSRIEYCLLEAPPEPLNADNSPPGNPHWGPITEFGLHCFEERSRYLPSR